MTVEDNARDRVALSVLQHLAKSTVVHVGFAFLAMGGWTLWANHDHGLAAAWPAALAQGLMSGAITLALKRALEAMVARLPGTAGYLIPPTVTAATILGVLAAVHRLIGTPEIARTIVVPWSVSTLYAIVYTGAVARGRSRTAIPLDRAFPREPPPDQEPRKWLGADLGEGPGKGWLASPNLISAASVAFAALG